MEHARSRWWWLQAGRWEPYAWLIYSVPFVAFAFDRRLTWWQSGLMFAIYPVFLAIYLGGQRVRGVRALWLVAGLDVIAMSFSPLNPGSGSFFIYGAATIGHVRPARAAAVSLAVHSVFTGLASYLLRPEPWYWVSNTLLSLLIGAVTIQASVNGDRDASLRLAQDEVTRLAQVAERERIARDLHDVLGHTLSVIVLKSELARKLADRDPVRAAQEIADVERIARAGLADVRQAISGYRAAGLAAELAHTRQLLTDAGIATTIDAPQVSLAASHDTALALALREATTNVIRHAQASSCVISVVQADDTITLAVSDDGRGGDAPAGSGLAGMRERIEALGGTLSRDTRRGTRLEIRVPLAIRGAAQVATLADPMGRA